MRRCRRTGNPTTTSSAPRWPHNCGHPGADGWRVPPARYVGERLSDAIRPWVEARLTPHPLLCFDEPVQLRSSAAAALPRAFIRTSLQSELYKRLIDRARAAGWYCRDLKGGHYPMLTEPR